ncbi:MAG TPA: PEP-CTERM sorting domain-containing protein [Rhizomicrobium sp.]|jgi:hypothetical protein
MTIRLSVLTAAILLFAAPGARADLVTNGGFETGDFSGWQVDNIHGTTFVSAYSGYVHSGTYGASLGVERGDNVLSQQLATIVGDSYNITFYLRGSTSPSTELKVFFGTDVLLDLVDSTQGDWTKYSFDEVATSASTLLAFNTNGTSFGAFALDDVSVVPDAVPEPASLVLFGSGLLAASGFRWRKRPKVVRR